MPAEVRAVSQLQLPPSRRGKVSAEALQRQVRAGLPANAFSAWL
jgi:hypothetical protein